MSARECYSQAESRSNQPIRCKSTIEGCPVIDDNGTVCGETDTLSVFDEFRKIYDECLKKLDGSDSTVLRAALGPFKQIVDNLWQQNNMLVEAVEELEQEASCQVKQLQNKLDKSCQKELHCLLKAKERDLQALRKVLSGKDELLSKYDCQIEQLKKDLKIKCKQYSELVKQVQCAAQKENSKCVRDKADLCDDDDDDGDDYNNDCDPAKAGELLHRLLTDLENQRNSLSQQVQSVECQLSIMAADRKKLIIERNETLTRAECLTSENDKLVKELACKRARISEREDELAKAMDQLKMEKNELLLKVNGLHENIQELNRSHKETRWSLNSEIEKKHDQIQELRKCLEASEDQLHHAEKQLHFKEEIIKELRKELKCSRKAASSECDCSSKLSMSREHSPPTQLVRAKSPPGYRPGSDSKKSPDDELKVDIHIFPLNDTEKALTTRGDGPKRCYTCCSIEVQTDAWTHGSPLKMRNVSTQHRTPVQKLPRSFGTLTVTPWSGNSDQGSIPGDDGVTTAATAAAAAVESIRETKKNLKGVYTVPFANI